MEPQQTICPSPLLSFAGDSWKFQFSEGKEKGRRSGIPPPEAAPACSGWFVSLSFPLTQQPNVKCVLYFHSWTLFLLPFLLGASERFHFSHSYSQLPLHIQHSGRHILAHQQEHSSATYDILLFPPSWLCCTCLFLSACFYLPAWIASANTNASCPVLSSSPSSLPLAAFPISPVFFLPVLIFQEIVDCRLWNSLLRVCALQDRKEKKGKRERGKTNVVVLLTMFPSFPIFPLSFSFFFLYQETE